MNENEDLNFHLHSLFYDVVSWKESCSLFLTVFFSPPESSCCAESLLCLGLPQNHKQYFWNEHRRSSQWPALRMLCVEAEEQHLFGSDRYFTLILVKY